MKAWIAGIALLAGCDQLFGIHDLARDAAGTDAAGDARRPLDGPPAGTVCAGSGPLHICAQEGTLSDRTFGASVDLDTDAGCDRVESGLDEQPPLCLVLARNLTLGAGVTLTAHGSRPLVLVAMDALRIEGVVDVSSHTGGVIGAAADDASCALANGDVQGAGESSSGGGAGGSFGTAGGSGGAAAGTTLAKAATLPINSTTLTVVRGGCPGGAGGTDHDAHTPAGGHSGGAVYLAARTSITMSSALVLANGAGGAGGTSANPADYPGGAGGGTGGLIMLDAPTITLADTTLMASGGGGGAGQGDAAAGGNTGGEPNPMMPLTAAGGALSTNTGGGGGAGSSLAMPGPGGHPLGMTGAGGGGGGGAGVIRVFGTAQTGTAKIVPAPT